MSLSSAMQIGRSALNASQLGIAATSNNMANAATAGYRRQIATLTPMRGAGGGHAGSIGMGVAVSDIRRQVSFSLEARTRSAISSEHASYTRQGIISAVENTLGELGDNDLSSQLSAFFNSWSERANLVQSSAVVVQQGRSLSSFVQRLRTDLTDQRAAIDAEVGALASRANELLAQVGDLNTSISQAEVGSVNANTLRDQRDSILEELATIMDVTVVEQGAGGVDVLVGSTPVVLGGRSRGVALELTTNADGSRAARLVTRDDSSNVPAANGSLGALLAERTDTIDRSISALDTLASRVIFEVNKIHSTGVGASWLRSTTGSLQFQTADRSLALNDPANTAIASLPFQPNNGGFSVNVRNTVTGTVSTVRIDVDLDGITAAGTAGTADDTSAQDIRDALDAVAGLAASFDPSGKLVVEADAGFEFSFADDSSAALATLGLNAYFTGSNARDIAVASDLDQNPDLLAVGSWDGTTLVENGSALLIASLSTKRLDNLGSRTLIESWRDHVTVVASASSAASIQAESATVVRESLDSQRAAVSGVSLDEEAINLMNFQRQYQAGARVIEVARQLMDTLISLV